MRKSGGSETLGTKQTTPFLPVPKLDKRYAWPACFVSCLPDCCNPRLTVPCQINAPATASSIAYLRASSGHSSIGVSFSSAYRRRQPLSFFVVIVFGCAAAAAKACSATVSLVDAALPCCGAPCPAACDRDATPAILGCICDVTSAHRVVAHDGNSRRRGLEVCRVSGSLMRSASQAATHFERIVSSYAGPSDRDSARAPT